MNLPELLEGLNDRRMTQKKVCPISLITFIDSVLRPTLVFSVLCWDFCFSLGRGKKSTSRKEKGKLRIRISDPKDLN